MVNDLGEVAGRRARDCHSSGSVRLLVGNCICDCRGGSRGDVSLGARQPDLAAKAGWVALCYASGVMAFHGASYSSRFARTDVSVSSVLILGKWDVIENRRGRSYDWSRFAMPGLAASIVFANKLLRAAGDTRFSRAVSLGSGSSASVCR